MAGVTPGDLRALVEAVPFALDTPLAVALRDDRGAVVEFSRGYWTDGGPVTSAQKFYAASLAKQITGAAVALMANKGLISPLDRVAKLLPELPEWMGEVTVLQLLGHTAGLPPAGVLESAVTHWTDDYALKSLRDAPLPSELPGSRFAYSNVGYIILARIIERVTGQDFASFAHAELFAPLDLPDMGFLDLPTLRALPQAAGMGGVLPLSHGDGGMWTTASNLVTWLMAQNHDRFSIANHVETPVRLNDGTTTNYGWGIGLRTYGAAKLFSHGGSWVGASCKAVRSPMLGVAVAAFAADAAEQGNVATLIDSLLAASA